MTPNEMKEFIKEAFSNVFEDMRANRITCEKYFSADYIQHVDGKTLNFNDFVSHIKAQKNIMQSVSIKFIHMVAENDKIATVHIVDGIKNNGDVIKGQVNAVFKIKSGKIALCNELTHLIKGKKSDKDLGSRH